MKIIPAVDIMDHRVVQLVGGVPGSEKIILQDPLETAGSWISKGAEYLHIIDLDGAFGKENNIPVIKKMIRICGVPVEVGGGIKEESTIKELIDAGVDRVILGTRAVKDTEWLRSMAFKFPERIVLALDTRNNEIVIKGWQESASISTEEMFRIIEKMPLAGVLNTNVDVEGQGKGINVARAREFISGCPHPVISSGGISSKEDALILSEAGADGAVVGIALYTGMIEPWTWHTPWNI